MTSSATSTDTGTPSTFQPWHFFVLLSMVGATAAVMLARDTHPIALLLLSAAVIASGAVALAVHHALAGFIGRAAPEPVLAPDVRADLEAQKALVLRSIKELQFDRAMRKVGDQDFAEMSERLRARALSLMEQLEQTPRPQDQRGPKREPEAAPAHEPALANFSRCPACGKAQEADARFCKHCGTRVAAAMMLFAALCGAGTLASAQTMPDPKQMSGQILPVSDVPAGTITVRVIRGRLDQNIPGQLVEFDVDGQKRTVATDASGRAQLSALRPGTRVRATTTVDGERLESQEAVIGQSGLRIMLVATDPEAATRAAADAALAKAAPVKGLVVLGPESRVVAEMADDRLNVFYLLEVLNSARTPVDIGGPMIFDLPREARGATVLQGSTPQATANGPRVIVTGPFAPGPTVVQIGYELPYSGGVARLAQVWPAALQQTTVLVSQIGGLSIASPQLSSKRDLSSQGQDVILGAGGPIPAGESLHLEIAGLPHRARWPRYLALSLAGVISLAGIWAAAAARPGQRRAA